MSLRIQVRPNNEVVVDEVGGNPNYVETISTTIGGFSQDALSKIRSGDYIAYVTVMSGTQILNVAQDGAIYTIVTSITPQHFQFLEVMYVESVFRATAYTGQPSDNLATVEDVTSYYAQIPCTLTLRYAPIPN